MHSLNERLSVYGRVVWVSKFKAPGLVFNWATKDYDEDRLRGAIKFPILVLEYTGRVYRVLSPMHVNELSVRIKSYLTQKAYRALALDMPQEKVRGEAYLRLSKEAPRDKGECRKWLTQRLIETAQSPDWEDHVFNAACQDLMDILNDVPAILRPKHPEKGKSIEGAETGIVIPPETAEDARGVLVSYSIEIKKDVGRWQRDHRGNSYGSRMSWHYLGYCDKVEECPLWDKHNMCVGTRCPLSNSSTIRVRGDTKSDKLARSQVGKLRESVVKPLGEPEPGRRVVLPFGDYAFVMHTPDEMRASLGDSYFKVPSVKMHGVEVGCAKKEFFRTMCAGTWMAMDVTKASFVAVKAESGGLIYNKSSEVFTSPTGEHPRKMTLFQAIFFSALMNTYGRALTEEEFKALLPYQIYGPFAIRAIQKGGLKNLRQPVHIHIRVKYVTDRSLYKNDAIEWVQDRKSRCTTGVGEVDVDTFLGVIYPDIANATKRQGIEFQIKFLGSPMEGQELTWVRECAAAFRRQNR